MNYYTSLIEDSEVKSIVRYGTNESGDEGTVMHAIFSLKGQEFMCIDSNVKHAFSFTPSPFLSHVIRKRKSILCSRSSARMGKPLCRWEITGSVRSLAG
jgi:predicted 3-demethylubiquinone-9 3-methyltransferase (glyoxalase superfamily)